MARRKTRTVYRRAKRAYRRASSGNSFKGIVDGAIAGVAGSYASKFLGGYGRPVAHIGVGYFMKNTTLKTLGGVELGEMLGGMIGGGGNGGGVR